jgi:dihydroorotase
MSEIPAKIFGLSSEITEGATANITIIDPDKKWRVKVDDFYSKGRNCPFDGWELQGKAIMTIVRGQIVMKDGRIIEEDRRIRDGDE